MSSLARRIQKRSLKKRGLWKAKEQRFVMLPDGGYVAVRHTKGGRLISGRRLRAQAMIREMQERIALRRAA